MSLALDSERLWVSFPHLLRSACLLSRDVCENPVLALVNCFPEQRDYFSMVCLQRTFCTFSYKINSRRLSILQGACSSSWGGFSKKRAEKLSHSEPLENCNSGFSTYLFYFRYLSIPHLDPTHCPFSFLFLQLFLSCICHPLSTDHWNWYNLDWTISLCFSCSMFQEPSATLCHKCQRFPAIVEHLQKPIKCQSRSSIATPVNCSHLEMSMSKPQCDGAGSWKSESTAPTLRSCKDLTLMLASRRAAAPPLDPRLWPRRAAFRCELITRVHAVVKPCRVIGGKGKRHVTVECGERLSIDSINFTFIFKAFNHN